MDNNNSYLLHQERCPKCSEQGHDKRGDNLAVYSDDHKYCYRCGYYVRNNGFNIYDISKPVEHKILLPNDCDITYPDNVLKWVSKYHLTRQDLLKYNVLYSEQGFNFKRGKEFYTADNVLLFPVWGESECLLGFQGRYFGHNKDVPKWIGKGRLAEVFNILEGRQPIVLTEDIVSAIAVNKVGHAAMPLYGNNARNRFTRLYSMGYKDIVLWLDPDMKSEMVRQAKYANGCNLKLVFSDCDPKCYTKEQIKEYLK